MDFNAIIAFAAIMAAFIALIAIWSENRRSQFALGVDLILRLDRHFNSVDFRKTRKTAANLLLSEDQIERTKMVAVEDVLDFFETVAILTRRRALDEELVWDFFFYWMHGWRHCANDHIESLRKFDQTLWADFITEYEECFVKIAQKHKRPHSYVKDQSSEEEKLRFLKRESNL